MWWSALARGPPTGWRMRQVSTYLRWCCPLSSWSPGQLMDCFVQVWLTSHLAAPLVSGEHQLLHLALPQVNSCSWKLNAVDMVAETLTEKTLLLWLQHLGLSMPLHWHLYLPRLIEFSVLHHECCSSFSHSMDLYILLWSLKTLHSPKPGPALTFHTQWQLYMHDGHLL